MSKVKSLPKGWQAKMSKIFLIVLCVLLLTPSAFAELDRDSTTVPELSAKTNLDSTDMFLIAQAADSANYKVYFDRIVDSVEDSIRGQIIDSWIKSGSAIALNKLASGTAAYLIVNNVSGVPTYVALSGDATISNAGALTIAANAIGTSEITDGTITTDDISTTAAIPLSKLASGTAAYIVVNNAGGVPTYVALTGDATISNGGVLTIAANAVGSSEITDNTIASADILDGTIATGDILDGTILTGDISDGTILTGDIADGTIVNADISQTAAIYITKLAAGSDGQIPIAGVDGLQVYRTISGDATISNLGVVDLADSLTDDFKFTGNLVYTNSQTFTPTDVTVEAGTGGLAVTDYSKIIKMSATAGAATLADISGGSDGQEIILHNSSASTYSITIDDGTEFQLNGSVDRPLGAGDSIHLWYDADVDIWYEIGGNN